MDAAVSASRGASALLACDRPAAQKALEACGRHCKTAIVMVLAGLSAEEAQSLLAKNNGYIRKALSNT